MRIFLPERIPIKWMVTFACLMMVVQIAEGTRFNFALLHFFFLILWAAAFNVAGGFRRASGAYIFFLGLLTIPVGTITKAFLGDPADSNSWAPTLSMLVFTVGMAMVGLTALCLRPLIRRAPSLAESVSRERNLRYREASIGCTVIGIIFSFSGFFLPLSLVSAANTLNVFIAVAVLIGTLHVIERSGGQKLFGLVNAVPAVYGFIRGVIGFSKEGMLTTATAMLIAVAYSRFRLRRVHIVSFAAFFLFAFYVLVPLAQVGRSSELGASSKSSDHLREAYDLVVHLHDTRVLYDANTQQVHETMQDYFSRDVGMLSRFTRWPGDDMLISYTSRGNYVGYAGLRYTFINWFPHLLLPNKESFRPPNQGGNYYAREIGILPPTDTTTGISFSPFAESFHIDGWFGLTFVAPLLWFMFFLAAELLAGDMRRTPWGLFLAVSYAHVAPEGGILIPVTYVVYGNLGLIVGILFTTFLAPAVGTLFVIRDPADSLSFPAQGVPTQFSDRKALATEPLS